MNGLPSNPPRPRWPGKPWLATTIGAVVLLCLASTLWVRSVFMDERLSCFAFTPTVSLFSIDHVVGIQIDHTPKTVHPFYWSNVLRHDVDAPHRRLPKQWFYWINFNNILLGGWLPWPLPVGVLTLLTWLSWCRYRDESRTLMKAFEIVVTDGITEQA